MARDPDPFEHDLVALLPALQAFARHLAKDSDRGEDLTQDALVNALKYREKFTAGTNLKAWVFFIARNIFYSERRRAWRMITMPYVGVDESVSLADMIPTPARQHHSLELDDLLEAISYLPPLMADAVLAIGEGISYEEAAAEFGSEVGTVKSRVSRGRAQLDQWFGLSTQGKAA